MKEFSGFMNELNSDTERSNFKVGMKVIMDFLDKMENEIEYEIVKNKKDKTSGKQFSF
ncbi:MAG: hypothetical protein IPM38_17625 [Ignavibacteria bacterium]|nr:hypothetical protein [Ignavibacteria bacterium]